jgi:P-loop containing NTP hydrolase pore-1
VKQLQDAIPDARVFYSSATGASEPANLAYMVRVALGAHLFTGPAMARVAARQVALFCSAPSEVMSPSPKQVSEGDNAEQGKHGLSSTVRIESLDHASVRSYVLCVTCPLRRVCGVALLDTGSAGHLGLQ